MSAKNPLFAEVGPRIDTRYMTRGELFRSARQFLMIGAVAAALSVLTVTLVGRAAHRVSDGSLVITLLIAFGLTFTGSVVASAWLSLIGFVRSSSYDPEAVREADEKQLEEFLARGGRL